MEYAEPYFEIERVCRRIASMNEEHYHSYNELYYLVDGDTKYFIAGDVYNIKKGDLVIIPAGVLHKTMYESGRQIERINVTFSDDYISDASIQSGIVPHIIRSKDFKFFPIEALLCEMEREYIAPDCYSPIMLRSHLSKLLVCICRLGTVSEPESSVSASDRPILNAARYITEHYGEELTLEGLAKQFAMSPGHFSKKFKNTTGFGLSKYITQVRIMNAEKLLLHTRLSVTEIAIRCGFSDPNYFASVFKAHKGIPPYRYAKLHRGA